MGIQEWIVIVLAVLGMASTIASMTPNKADDKVVQFLLDLVNVVGGNIGRAKNKD